MEKALMRALVLKEFGTFEVQDRPSPPPGAGEVQLQIIATGICGSDIHGFTGKNGRRVPGQIMGHESVGRIVALGADTGSFGLEVGSLATFNPVVLPESDLAKYAGREQHSPDKKVIGVAADIVSAFAEQILVPARNIVVLPESTPVNYGALIEPIAVAVHAVGRAGVEAGDNVLVVGGGPIGQSVILAALRAGAARVLVSELDSARRALCERLGATVIEPGERPLAERVLETLGAPADVALDAVGISATLRDALLSTAFGGTVCLVGMGSPELALDAFRISTEERTLVGSFSYSVAEFQDAADWVATAPEELAELISREVALDQAQEAFAGLARMDGTPGKVLVRF
jgi:threonine dehydrogenase-like Zn-dependent dehydrogenase